MAQEVMHHHDSATGSMIAFVLIVAALILGYVLFRNGAFDGAGGTGSTGNTINIDVPRGTDAGLDTNVNTQ